MTVWGIVVAFAAGTRNELLLFAAVGLLLGGLDDLLLDGIYVVRRLWRAATVYRRHPRMTADRMPPSNRPGTLAVFIPAWDEGMVIGPMLRHCLSRWATDDVHLFVGVYPNDPASIVAVADVAATSDRVTMVINPLPGPTTKADCLNNLWYALLRWETGRGSSTKAIVLHDAEDVVHGDAIRVMSALIDRFALVQLPVLPLASPGSRWISGHYCDEFAEAHGKALLVREALGAAMPSAGVGCAVAKDMITVLADARGGRPFDPDSLTEDYELGLRIGEQGGRGILVRMRDARGDLVATREYFPDTISDAVKQKARWTVGIALAGWDRLGWGKGLAEAWMRLHDRRALLAAFVLAAAYAGLLFTALTGMAALAGLSDPVPLPNPLPLLLAINFVLLLWRTLVRMAFVYRAYGPVEALRSVPRMIIANMIAMMAARRAIIIYIRLWTGGTLRWDKTAHRFPDVQPDNQRIEIAA
ncbi:MAG TPA: glycosyl transferase family protein [Sphingobium sp.]|uniref:glycosyl transferase family protein n=1 Tax=Sphingobium sp. TaxID=1912891 RepID=UPI002ECFFE9D